jgi:hypothetical protein
LGVRGFAESRKPGPWGKAEKLKSRKAEIGEGIFGSISRKMGG